MKRNLRKSSLVAIGGMIWAGLGSCGVFTPSVGLRIFNYEDHRQTVHNSTTFPDSPAKVVDPPSLPQHGSDHVQADLQKKATSSFRRPCPYCQNQTIRPSLLSSCPECGGNP